MLKNTILFSTFILLLYIGGKSIYLYNKYNVKKVQDIENYYIEFLYFKDEEGFKLDENNVSYVDYSKISSMGVTNQLSYNPVQLGLVGLKNYQYYMKTNNNVYKTIFLAQANWLVANVQKNGVWNINHVKSINQFKLNPPWISALSQGLGISVLVRAYNINQDKKYLLAARSALKPFMQDIKNGGIVTENNFGKFYEEYPIKGNSTHVLNGFIYALYGLYDLYKYDNNQLAKELFDDGIKTLKKIVVRYELTGWTRYDLNPNRNLRNHWGYASPWYQKLHAAQLYGIYMITDDDYFLSYSNKIENQVNYSWVNLFIYPAYVGYTDFVKVYRLLKG